MNELKFKPKSKIREFFGEKFIAVNAFVALIAIVLIFVFIFKEAVPIFTDQEIIEEASLDKMIFKQEFYEGRDAKWSWQPNSEVPRHGPGSALIAPPSRCGARPPDRRFPSC